MDALLAGVRPRECQEAVHQVTTMWDIVADPDKLSGVLEELVAKQDVLETLYKQRAAAGHVKVFSSAMNLSPGSSAKSTGRSDTVEG